MFDRAATPPLRGGEYSSQAKIPDFQMSHNSSTGEGDFQTGSVYARRNRRNPNCPSAREEHMSMHRRICLLAILGALVVSFTWTQAQQRNGSTVAIDNDDIGGVVTSMKGPEAGVWVIAETTDLPAKFVKTVVTDDQGRYVLPDLPPANYQVFVRGYGLVDSPHVPAKPGQHLDLKAVAAPDGRAAAQVYPANYWLSLLKIPKGDLSDKDVVIETKRCFSCHQVGDVATRDLSKNLGSYKSSLEKWDHQVTMGPSGPGMAANFKA